MTSAATEAAPDNGQGGATLARVALGILAAIVIPQFTSASDSAKQGNLETQLQTIRSQLELYRVQHNDVYPTVAQMFTNLTNSPSLLS